MRALMKSVLTAAAFAAVTSTVAVAADMPVKTRPVMSPAVQVVSWTGFYWGGQVGAVSTSYNTSCEGECFGPLVIDSSHASVLAGGYIGYNWQTNNVVFGIEGDVNALFGKGSPTASNLNATDDGYVAKSDWNASVRGRIGWLVTPNAMLFATGGVAFTNFKLNNPACPDCSNFDDPLNIVDGETRVGWVVGGGIEYALDSFWHLKLEYLHADFGSTSTTLGCESEGCAIDFVTFRTKLKQDMVRVGLSYAFSNGPVVARY
jgi:outer membrane immunogenic protein